MMRHQGPSHHLALSPSSLMLRPAYRIRGLSSSGPQLSAPGAQGREKVRETDRGHALSPWRALAYPSSSRTEILGTCVVSGCRVGNTGAREGRGCSRMEPRTTSAVASSQPAPAPLEVTTELEARRHGILDRVLKGWLVMAGGPPFSAALSFFEGLNRGVLLPLLPYLAGEHSVGLKVRGRCSIRIPRSLPRPSSALHSSRCVGSGVASVACTPPALPCWYACKTQRSGCYRPAVVGFAMFITQCRWVRRGARPLLRRSLLCIPCSVSIRQTGRCSADAILPLPCFVTVMYLFRRLAVLCVFMHAVSLGYERSAALVVALLSGSLYAGRAVGAFWWIHRHPPSHPSGRGQVLGSRWVRWWWWWCCCCRWCHPTPAAAVNAAAAAAVIVVTCWGPACCTS